MSDRENFAPPMPLPAKILLIEDNDDDRAFFRRVFARRADEFSLLEATTIEAGLNYIASENPDCIILDYDLPDGTAIQLLARWQCADIGDMPAVIVVTGHGTEQAAVDSMKLGASDYLPKITLLESTFVRSVRHAIERARLKGAVTKYQQELEQSYKALTEFTHTASHDLKAPLRHIVSYCEILRDDYGDKMGPEGLGYAVRLIVNARRLQRLVDDLLAYSEALNKAEEMRNVDFEQVAQEVLDVLEESVNETGATITVVNLPRIQAYPLRIRQLLQNLISNAIKYRAAESPRISLNCEDIGEEYKFSVADNGLGIEADYRDMIFEAFKRLHSRDKIEGSGLGLSICKKIVGMHNGRIWVESTPGEGSTFYFTIPKATTSAKA